MDFVADDSTEIILQLVRGDLSKDEVVILSGKDKTREKLLLHFQRLFGRAQKGEPVTVWVQDRRV